MELKQLIADDDAVSPVIGVILMVAITVILAAVIGTFVLGIGQGQQATPSASFDFDYNSSSTALDVAHTGGDTFNEENSASVEVTDGSSNSYAWLENDGPISAGTTVNASAEVSVPSSGDTYRVVWTASSGDQTQTLADFTVP